MSLPSIPGADPSVCPCVGGVGVSLSAGFGFSLIATEDEATTSQSPAFPFDPINHSEIQL
jgi:hypothetical protein